MQIALVQKKGGSGKTTLCILLHETIRQTGQRVAVRDYDAQGSATKALSRFGGTAEVPGEKYDVLLIDTPPSLTMTATAAAVSAARHVERINEKPRSGSGKPAMDIKSPGKIIS